VTINKLNLFEDDSVEITTRPILETSLDGKLNLNSMKSDEKNEEKR
jgi:hypothetical protein